MVYVGEDEVFPTPGVDDSPKKEVEDNGRVDGSTTVQESKESDETKEATCSSKRKLREKMSEKKVTSCHSLFAWAFAFTSSGLDAIFACIPVQLFLSAGSFIFFFLSYANKFSRCSYIKYFNRLPWFHFLMHLQEANKPPDSWFELKVNTHVYVTGLPEDVTLDEVSCILFLTHV